MFGCSGSLRNSSVTAGTERIPGTSAGQGTGMPRGSLLGLAPRRAGGSTGGFIVVPGLVLRGQKCREIKPEKKNKLGRWDGERK